MPISKSRSIEDLLSFTYRWCRIRDDSARVLVSSIPGFVPKPLAELFASLGNWPVPPDKQWLPGECPNWKKGIFQEHNRLLPLKELNQCDGRMCFAEENQSIWKVFTRTSGNDPPVDVIYDQGTETEERIRCSQKLSHFLTTFCLNELLHGRGNTFSSPGPITKLQAQFDDKFSKLWQVDMFVDPDWCHKFYALQTKALLLQIHSHDMKEQFWWCNVKTKSSDAYRQVKALA